MLSLTGWFRAKVDRIRKRSGDQQQKQSEGGGLAIAIGSLLDGIPEAVVLGVGLLAGKGVSVAMFAAIFLSNFPEGLSSAAGMKRAGRFSKLNSIAGDVAQHAGLSEGSFSFLFFESPRAMHSSVRFEYVARRRLAHDYVLQTHQAV